MYVNLFFFLLIVFFSPHNGQDSSWRLNTHTVMSSSAYRWSKVSVVLSHGLVDSARTSAVFFSC